MDTNKLPGYAEAKRLGYELYAICGQGLGAWYVKDGLTLKVSYNGTATLMGMYKLIQLTTAEISFPHRNFKIFEGQLRQLLDGVQG